MKKSNVWMSGFTADDLYNMESSIAEAQAYYEERLARYNSSVAIGHEGWAKRNILPSVKAAKNTLDGLLEQYEKMLQTTSLSQNIGLVDLSAEQATTTETITSVPWSTIGLMAGALALIVIIYKIL